MSFASCRDELATGWNACRARGSAGPIWFSPVLGRPWKSTPVLKSRRTTEREIPLGGDPQAKEPHLRGYLAYVWEIVGRIALEQVLGTAKAKARNGAAGES